MSDSTGTKAPEDMRDRIEEALRSGATAQGMALVEAIIQDALKARREPVTVVLNVERDGTDVYAASQDVRVVLVDTNYYRENDETVDAADLEEMLEGRLLVGDANQVSRAIACIRSELADYVEHAGPRR